MTPRLRMLAGPNGSGKTTLAAQLKSDYAVNFYSFLNADILFAEIAKSNKTACPFSIEPQKLADFVKNSTYPDEYKKFFFDGAIVIDDEDYIVFAPRAVNSYTVAMIADFFKEQFVDRKISFSFETVFSHPSKINLLKRAQDAGFRTYMYFIATESPIINQNRIADRVSHGGHNVPEEKIYPRYQRCLAQIQVALQYLNRAYFFDNSGENTVYLAEYSKEDGFILHSDLFPQWFNRFVIAE